MTTITSRSITRNATSTFVNWLAGLSDMVEADTTNISALVDESRLIIKPNFISSSGVVQFVLTYGGTTSTISIGRVSSSYTVWACITDRLIVIKITGGASNAIIMYEKTGTTNLAGGIAASLSISSINLLDLTTLDTVYYKKVLNYECELGNIDYADAYLSRCDDNVITNRKSNNIVSCSKMTVGETITIGSTNYYIIDTNLMIPLD